MLKKLLLTCSIVVLSALICANAFATNFNKSDLVGTWRGYQIVTGDAPNDDPRWGYGSLIINSSSNYTATWNSPSSSNEVATGTVTINLAGIVRVDSDPLFHGVMNNDKNQIILIDGSSQSDGNGLLIFNKFNPSTTFNSQDLLGTWRGYQVVSGDKPSDDPRWGYGTLVVDSSNNFTAIWNSPSSSNEISTGTVQVSGAGIVSVNNNNLFHGVMNNDKNQLVLIDGTNESDGHGFLIFEKYNPAATFSSQDLLGRWRGYQIVSGDKPIDDPRWGYGTMVVSSSNNYTVTWNSPTSSNETTTGTVQITGSGVVEVNNNSLFHGIMNNDKNQIILIDGTNESDGNGMIVMVRNLNKSLPFIPLLLLGN